MGRILAIVGLAYALCALVTGSADPDQWSGVAQAFVLVIAGSTVMMNIEALLRQEAARRSGTRSLHHGPAIWRAG